jgi:hypothetical protein
MVRGRAGGLKRPMIAATLLFLAAQPAADTPNAKEAAQRVAACGFPTRSLTVRYDPLLEDEVVTVRTAAPPPSEAQLGCAARAQLPAATWMEFRPYNVQRRYLRAYAAVAQASGLAEIRTRLADRGLLARLPVWDGERATLPEAAAGIERLCGLEPGSTLAAGDGFLRLRVGARFYSEKFGESLQCVVQGAGAIGLPFGFIGNEARMPPKRRAGGRGVRHRAG